MRKLNSLVPTPQRRVAVWNTICLIVGAALYAGSLREFAGLVLMGEAIIVSIEMCWPKKERPE